MVLREPQRTETMSLNKGLAIGDKGKTPAKQQLGAQKQSLQPREQLYLPAKSQNICRGMHNLN